MRVVIQPDAKSASEFVANRIAKLVSEKPDCVLGLATGSTPLKTYELLIQKHQNEGLDFSRVTTFNLDEYVGLPPHHSQSYRNFMNENLFSRINIKPSQTFVPDGMAHDVLESCQAYEDQIRIAGGIDLQLLGIGTDGHIAFNEPGSSFASRTRIKSLLSETINDNARFFEAVSQVPRLAITMGVGTILEAKQCVLIATGANKANAIEATVEGPMTSQITASALQLHRQAIVVVDEKAATKLKHIAYYRNAEHIQQELEQRKVLTTKVLPTPQIFSSRNNQRTQY